MKPIGFLSLVFVGLLVFPTNLWSDSSEALPAGISSPADFKKIRIRWFPVDQAEKYLIYSLGEDGEAVQVEEVGCQASGDESREDEIGPLSGLCIAETHAGKGSVEIKISAVNKDWEEGELSGPPEL